MGRGAHRPPSIVEIVSFETTRFGEWVVKLSYIQAEDTFVVVAYHPYNFEAKVKFFQHELQVVKFVNSLGEKYE